MAKVISIFTHSSQYLGGFITVSIVIHLLLLGYLFQSSTSLPMPITSAPLAVTMLQSQDEQTNQVASESKTAKPADSNADTKAVAAQMQAAEPVASKGQAVITAPAPQSQSIKSSAATMVAERAVIATSFAPPQSVAQQEQSKMKEPTQPQIEDEDKTKPRLSLAQVREQLRGELHENFARHFHYPRLARKRGWQGEGLLNLKIESDGTISRILLTKSTGYSLLDDTAINTVMKIKNVKEMGQWLNGRSIEMELPVIYRLING